MFYLLSSLPDEPVDIQRRHFSGLSPGGLANGGYLKDYQGHSFWDTETWMYPPVLMLWPHIAKDLLLYRMNNINSARDRARETGYEGARYPWESGFTGVEVTPDCCPETRDNQQHITGTRLNNFGVLIKIAYLQLCICIQLTSASLPGNTGQLLAISIGSMVRNMASLWR